jgi:short-subunit dehydrogenase
MSGTPHRILVTGASSGIGEATVRELADRGYEVDLAARRVEKMESIAEDIHSNGGVARVHELDLQSPESIETLAQKMVEQDVPPDTLVNNAGYGVYGRVDQIPIEEARALFETNVTGTMDLTKRAVSWMKSLGHGRVINVTSGVAKRGFPAMNYYSASKAALESLSESMKLELEPFDITVQVVYPIRTETEFSNAARRFVPGEFDFPDHGPTQSAETVAQTIAEGLKSERFRLHPHYSSRFIGVLNEVAPWLVEWVTGLRETVRRTFD